MQGCRIKILVSSTATICEARLHYVLGFIQNHPLAKNKLSFVEQEEDFIINYSSPKKEQDFSTFFIPAQHHFFLNTLDKEETLQANTYSTSNKNIYSVEKGSKKEEPFLKGKKISFDIFETIFFHISRYEEWNCAEEDKDLWDMMKTQKQFLVRHNIHQEAVVDHLVFAFLEALGLNPELKPTTISISHDIDEVRHFPNLWKPIRRSGGLLWKGRSLKSQRKLWEAYIKTILGRAKDPFDTFDWMISKGGNVEKIIYFLVGGDTKFDTPYDLSTPRMQEIFETCKDRGYAIGLHPSYAAWKREDLFIKEKTKLEEAIDLPIHRSRQHYLHFDFVRTAAILERNNISQDSSIGFNECIGFRCGTGFPYQLYNFLEERSFSFIESPLVFMDSALFGECEYQVEQIKEVWDSFLEKNKHLTHINFNFHNSRFFDAWLHDIPLRERYEQMLINE